MKFLPRHHYADNKLSRRAGAGPAPKPERPSVIPRAPLPPEAPKRAWIWGLAAVVVLGIAVGYWQRQAFTATRRAAATHSFRTVKAFTGSLERSVRVAGVTAAERFSMLLAPLMRGSRHYGHGESFMLVLQKLVAAGSRVKKGDVVAEFDRQYMLVRLDDYKATADQHDRNVVKLKAALAVKRAAYDQTVIAARGAMEKAALDIKKAPALSAIAQEKNRLNYEEATAVYQELRKDEPNMIVSESAAIARAEADLRVSRLEYDRAQRNADRMLVKAPIDGMAVMMSVRRGGETAQIQEGDQVYSSQPYLRIVDLSKMVVDASVNQVDAQSVRLGMHAKVRFDAYPDLELPAKVVAVGVFAQSTGWRGAFVRSVPIRLELDHTDPVVIPDLSVSADLVIESVPNATIVPREAVFGGDDEPYAFVHDRDGGWEKRPLEVVTSNATAVAVRSGVNPGDVLAVEPPSEKDNRTTPFGHGRGAPARGGCTPAAWDNTPFMQQVNVGIVGSGNVGSGSLAILAENADQIALKLGFRAECHRRVAAGR